MGRQAEQLVRTAPPRKPPTQTPFAFLAKLEPEQEPVSLLNCDAETMRDGVALWLELGHAIPFGKTSDGGAVAITLLAGGQRTSRYYTDVATLECFLVSLKDNARVK